MLATAETSIGREEARRQDPTISWRGRDLRWRHDDRPAAFDRTVIACSLSMISLAVGVPLVEEAVRLTSIRGYSITSSRLYRGYASDITIE